MEKNYGEKSGGKGDGDRGDRGDRGDGEEKRGGRGFARRKVCRFCADKKIIVDFKDQSTLKYFVTASRATARSTSVRSPRRSSRPAASR